MSLTNYAKPRNSHVMWRQEMDLYPSNDYLNLFANVFHGMVHVEETLLFSLQGICIDICVLQCDLFKINICI